MRIDSHIKSKKVRQRERERREEKEIEGEQERFRSGFYAESVTKSQQLNSSYRQTTTHLIHAMYGCVMNC